MKVKSRILCQMIYYSSTLWVLPQSCDVWISLSGPAGSLLGSGKQLNTQAELLHCTELYWSVTVAEGGERERDQRTRVTHHHVISSPQRERDYISCRTNTEQRKEWAAGNRHIHSRLGGEKAGVKGKDKDEKTQGITDGVWKYTQYLVWNWAECSREDRRWQFTRCPLHRYNIKCAVRVSGWR